MERLSVKKCSLEIWVENFLCFGKIHRNARCRVRWTWKTANCTGEDLTDDDKNALENMKIKIDAL